MNRPSRIQALGAITAALLVLTACKPPPEGANAPANAAGAVNPANSVLTVEVTLAHHAALATDPPGPTARWRPGRTSSSAPRPAGCASPSWPWTWAHA